MVRRRHLRGRPSWHGNPTFEIKYDKPAAQKLMQKRAMPASISR